MQMLSWWAAYNSYWSGFTSIMKRAKTATNQNGVNGKYHPTRKWLLPNDRQGFQHTTRRKMQREKSVKVKEVITSLCKLLSGLSVESIPTAEAFRRAKFNREDSVRATRVAISFISSQKCLTCIT